MLKILPALLFFCVSLFAFTADARGPAEDLLKNYFYVQLAGGDRGTVYIDSEHDLAFLPDQTNKDYVHICRASWSYNEALNKFAIKRASDCRLLNGQYRVSFKDHQLILRGKRSYVLKTLLKRR